MSIDLVGSEQVTNTMGEPTTRTDSGNNPEQVPSAPQRRGVGIPLGRWAGVPIRAHWSVALALALFTEIVATSVLPAADPGESTIAYWLTGSITAAIFLTTLLAHELAHAVTARHY